MTVTPAQRNTILAGLDIGDHISFDVLSVQSTHPCIDVAVLREQDYWERFMSGAALDGPVPIETITLERVPQGWKRIK